MNTNESRPRVYRIVSPTGNDLLEYQAGSSLVAALAPAAVSELTPPHRAPAAQRESYRPSGGDGVGQPLHSPPRCYPLPPGNL